MTENDRDIKLLHDDPNQLIVKHQDMIHAVAIEALEHGWFPAPELADVKQTINLELLAKIDTVRKNYDGRALLRTYLSRIALNVCRRYRKRNTRVNQATESPDSLPSRDQVLEGILIDETRGRFRTILLLYGPRLPKILLFLKIFHRIPVTSKDVLNCYPHCQEGELEPIVAHFSGEYSSMLDQEVVAILAPFANKMEKTTTSADGYRRWIAFIIGDICDLLNGDPPTARFNRENFSYLFEDYCFRF